MLKTTLMIIAIISLILTILIFIKIKFNFNLVQKIIAFITIFALIFGFLIHLTDALFMTIF